MHEYSEARRMTWGRMPTPAKALSTCIILTLALGMLGAMGQIYIHDIIPTFFADTGNDGPEMPTEHHGMKMNAVDKASLPASSRGDLFSDLAEKKVETERQPLFKNEQFAWTLKWTHIHLFGMNMIFILMGAITLLLDLPSKARTWLVVLPFIGVIIDISAMWLKAFVSPIFFWLHVPGGSAFAIVFFYVSLRALREMWGKPVAAAPSHSG